MTNVRPWDEIQSWDDAIARLRRHTPDVSCSTAVTYLERERDALAARLEAEIARLTREVTRLRAALHRLVAQPTRQSRSTLVEAPCLWCGYAGAGYWQAETHAATCPWYAIGGAEARMDGLAARAAAQPGRP